MKLFFLILQVSRDFRGIGLVEVLCKMVTGILNRRLTLDIQCHDTLHGSHAVRGMGTASL